MIYYYMEKKLVAYWHGSASSEEEIQYLVISIGLNVNEKAFSEETMNIATSLKKEYEQQTFCRENIIRQFIEKLEQYINSI